MNCANDKKKQAMMCVCVCVCVCVRVYVCARAGVEIKRMHDILPRWKEGVNMATTSTCFCSASTRGDVRTCTSLEVDHRVICIT